MGTLLRPLLSMILLLLLAGADDAGAGRGRDRHHGPHLGAMLDYHAEALGLDETTRQAIREIVESSHERGAELRRAVRAERRALHELLRSEPVDRDAIMAQVDRVAAREADAERHRIDALLQIREQLTPEQRAALVDLREEMSERHLGPMREHCEQDLAEHCPEGGLPCLFRHREALSDPCSQALDAFPGGCGHHGKWGKKCGKKWGKGKGRWGPGSAPGSE